MKTYIIKITLSLTILTTSISCKKLVETGLPKTSLNSEVLFSSDETAIAAVTNLYASMTDKGFSGTNNNILSIGAREGLQSDELDYSTFMTNASGLALYRNSMTPSILIDPWGDFYKTIFEINNLLDGVEASSTLTAIVKNQLTGELKFMRAFVYFYLVNSYGDVPLVLTRDYVTNEKLGRSPRVLVENQVISDLKDAKNLLSEEFLSGKLIAYSTSQIERVRPSKWAAIALLARMYLYNNSYQLAEQESTLLINKANLFDLPNLDQVFLKNSVETIWSLQPIGTGNNSNTPEGRLYLLPTSGPNGSQPLYLSTRVFNAFEIGDQRKVKWTGVNSNYPFIAKYKIGSANSATNEYSVVLRLAEQYLIRAEARAQQNKLIGIGSAKEDIDKIRVRAGLLGTTAITKDDLLNEILNQRRFELFGEWGHRWFDLKRLGKINDVMINAATAKGGIWNSTRAFYPISQGELDRSPLLTQNAGY